MATSSLNAPYLVLTGVIIIGLAAIFTVYQPLVNDTLAIRKDAEAKSATLADREAFLRTLDQKIAALNGQTLHEQQLEVVLPADESVEDILRVIHQAAAASAATIESISNQSASVQGSLNAQRARGETVAMPAGVDILAFTLEFNGGYNQLRQFLTALEKSPRLIDITRIEITRNQQQLDVIDGQVSLRFYKHSTEPVNP